MYATRDTRCTTVLQRSFHNPFAFHLLVVPDLEPTMNKGQVGRGCQNESFLTGFKLNYANNCLQTRDN